MTGRAPPTDTLISRARRAAKRASRDGSRTHGAALEAEAAQAGYQSWRELLLANRNARAAPAAVAGPAAPGDAPAGFRIRIDPKLPRLFDSTPNEDRSRRQLRDWWDKPFAAANPDGTYAVRCLDGGAWDRATWYGAAPDAESARQLAWRKLRQWKAMRAEPVAMFREGALCDIVRMPQRPGDEVEILASGLSSQEAAKWLADHREGHPAPGL